MTRRPDLTCITDNHIIMVEIKSNKDTFLRLEHQILEYRRYSNHIYVVVDILHREKAQKFRENNTASYCVDFIIFDNGSLLRLYEGIKEYTFKEPYYRPLNLDFVGLLWADERRNLLRNFLGFSSLGNCKEFEALENVYTPKELVQLTFETFKNRWEHISSQDKRFCKNYKGGKPTSQIKHIEYKQILFNDYLLSIGKKIKEPKNSLFALKENIL